jgi:hypothetical protein
MEEQMQDPAFVKQWHENQAKFKLQVLKSTNIEQRNNVLNPIVTSSSSFSWWSGIR